MENNSFFSTTPLGILFICTVVIIILSIWLGIYVSKKRAKNVDAGDDVPVNAIAGATMALLGFMLAFAFGFTASRFDSRRQLLLSEANSIGTTYLRAGFLPEPHSSEVRDLLRKYVDLRLELAASPERFRSILEQSNGIQNEIWKHAEAIAFMDLKNPEIVSLFINSLNETIDLQTTRTTVALVYRLPDLMWYALLLLVIISMFEVGYLFKKSKKTNWILITAVSVAFSLVILIVLMLDRTIGPVKMNQQPMIELQKSIRVN